MTEFGAKTELARGILNWPRAERQTNRYGLINIQTGGQDPGDYQRKQLAELLARPAQDKITYLEDDPTAMYAIFADAPLGTIGRLVVEVLVSRESHHIGDVKRKIMPETPEVGDLIVLGEGELFLEVDEFEGISAIGLLPEDGRETDWLDPQALYRAHSQTVGLYFEPRLP